MAIAVGTRHMDDVVPPKADSPLYDMSFLEVLHDLLSRFVLNLPTNELSSMERIYFQCEQAHWFYEDFLMPYNPQLTHMKLRSFSYHLLSACTFAVPLVQQYVSGKSDGLNTAFDRFMKYKLRVPVCGAILLNKQWNKALLVKGCKSTTWTFPKGKINQDEPELDCATREVHEEVGFDVGPLLAQTAVEDGKNPDYIDAKLKDGHKVRLYIVPGLDDDYPFQTLTRKEISEIGWVSLHDLPSPVRGGAHAGVREEITVSGQRFWQVAPFVGPLRKWIKTNSSVHPRRPRDDTPTYDPNSQPLVGQIPGDGVSGTPVTLSAEVESARPAPPPVSSKPADGTGQLKALLGLGGGDVPQPSHPPAPAPAPQTPSALRAAAHLAQQGDTRNQEFLTVMYAGQEAHQAGFNTATPNQAPPFWTREQAEQVKRRSQSQDLLAALNAPSQQPAADPPSSAGCPPAPPVNLGRAGQTQALLSLLGGSQPQQQPVPHPQAMPRAPIPPLSSQSTAASQLPQGNAQAQALLNLLGSSALSAIGSPPQPPQPPQPQPQTQPLYFPHGYPQAPLHQPYYHHQALSNLLSSPATQPPARSTMPPQTQQQSALLGLLGPPQAQAAAPVQPPQHPSPPNNLLGVLMGSAGVGHP